MNGVYEFMVISSKGELLFYDDYTKKNNLLRKNGTYVFPQDFEHRFENIKGICEAFKFIVSNLSPTPVYGIKNFSTNKYKFSVLELPTKLKFIVISEPDNRNFDSALKTIYTDVYLNSVTRNILNRDKKIHNLENFRLRIQECISNVK